MIRILNCKNKNYKKKLSEFLDIRRSRKSYNSSAVQKILNDIKNSLIDRCGTMPLESLNLLNNKKIYNRIKDTGIDSIKSYEDRTNFILSNSLKKSILDNLLKLISKDSAQYLLTKDNKFVYKINETDSNKRRNNVNLLLDEIL